MHEKIMQRAQHARQVFQNLTPAARLPGARFEVKNLATDWAEIYIYGDIAWYDITAAMVADVLKDLSAHTLSVRINSMGGDVFDGVAIYNLLRNYAQSNGAKILMQIDAIAASIASVIAMAGDEIVIAKNAQMMIHRASAGCIGDADDMQAMADVLKSIENDMIVPTYRSRTGLSSSDLLAMMKADTWMNAQTAVDKGFADRVAADSGAKALCRPGDYSKAPAGGGKADTDSTLVARMRTRMAQLSLEPEHVDATTAARRRMEQLARGA